MSPNLRYISLDKCNYFKGCLLLKGVVHPKIQMVSLFTHCHVVPNQYELYVEHKIRCFEECW